VHPYKKLLTEKREGNLEMSESGKRGQLRTPRHSLWGRGIAGSRGHSYEEAGHRQTECGQSRKGEGRGDREPLAQGIVNHLIERKIIT
jgi:hypothetical protein